VTINLGLVIRIFGWVKTLEWQAPVQLPSTPTPGVFLIVTVLHTFHPCKWLDIVVCSKDCLIADLSDHMFYGGCRLMYRPISRSTVDWHIDRYVCRDSVEYRPSVDRESVDISAEWCFLSVVIASVVCRHCIGEVSVVYRYWENEPTLILPIRVWGRGPKLISIYFLLTSGVTIVKWLISLSAP